MELLRSLCKEHPTVQRGMLAQSLCGRSVEYLEIGNQQNPVLLTGTYHGMEWITFLLLLRFAERLCTALETGKQVAEIDVGSFLRRRGVVIVPCVNPDGVEISLHGCAGAGEYQELVQESAGGDTSRWQANARGVDLNHNFNAGWQELHELERKMGITGPGPTRYGGPFPESEPETKGVTLLCRRRRFRHALAFHSQGEEIYWKYGDSMPSKAELMAQVLSVSSGYALSTPETIATGGGFKDWFLSECKRPAFTIEVGRGSNPLPIEQFSPIYRRLEEMMVFSVIM